VEAIVRATATVRRRSKRVPRIAVYMEYLAWYERVSVSIHSFWEFVKHELRIWLGPEPSSYYLLSDGRVLPSSITLPEDVRPHTYIYDPHTKYIRLYTNSSGRFRPLPFLGMRFEDHDISDWVGEIRAYPVPNLSVKQIVTLWSLSHTTYIPARLLVHVVKNDGTEGDVEIE